MYIESFISDDINEYIFLFSKHLNLFLFSYYCNSIFRIEK